MLVCEFQGGQQESLQCFNEVITKTKTEMWRIEGILEEFLNLYNISLLSVFLALAFQTSGGKCTHSGTITVVGPKFFVSYSHRFKKEFFNNNNNKKQPCKIAS